MKYHRNTHFQNTLFVAPKATIGERRAIGNVGAETSAVDFLGLSLDITLAGKALRHLMGNFTPSGVPVAPSVPSAMPVT